MTTIPGLDQVTRRITELQGRMGLAPAGAAPASSSSSASSGAFSAALADVLGTGDDGSGLTGALAGLTGATTGPAAGSTTGSTGARAVALARTFTGVPYRWGGTDPSSGLDCSGLTQLVYGRLGVDLPRVAADQARSGTAVPSLDQAQPGDLVFFGSPAHHVGIYAGDGMMIDAPHTGSTVGLHAVSGYGQVSAVRRVAPATSAASSTATQALALARAQLLAAVGPSSGLSSLSSPSSASSPAGITSAHLWVALL